MLHWWVLRVRAIWRSRPGTSWATTCRSVECEEDSESNCEAGGDFDLEVGGVVHVAAGFKQLLDGDLLRDDIVEIGEEAVFLAGVELDGAEDVGELEAVDDDAGIVGEGAGLDDVHAPGGEGSGHVGKEAACGRE